MTLYSYQREFPLTYFDRCTLPKNNSLSVKGETGTEHALDLSLEKVVKPSEMGLVNVMGLSSRMGHAAGKYGYGYGF